MQDQNSESLSRAIHAARAGQPALAKYHCQQAAEIQSDDPLVWLWLAWLSDSPSSMYQCLQVAQRDDRYHKIAEAGIAFARALCGAETDFEDSPNEAADSADVASAPFRISDAQKETPAIVAALPEPQGPISPESNDKDPAETVEPTAELEPVAELEAESALKTDPEQQCVEALNELSAAVNGEAASLTTDNSSEIAGLPLDDGADLFAVAQAMLGESADGEPKIDDGLVAGVSVTSDPWTAKHSEETGPSTETENVPELAETTAPTDNAAESAETASPAWADGLKECDDQSEWSAEADGFVPIAESASIVKEEARAELPSDKPADKELTGDAASLESNFVNAPQEGYIEPGSEQAGKVDDSKVNPTVLVVDDSPTVRKLVQMTLHGRGYNIVTAFDGVSAIKEIARHEPSLILLDTNMPRLDGYQLCSLIRKHERTRQTPVVMLSGKDGVFDRIRGKMIGCTSYIVKPFVPETLIEEVEKHIGEHTGAATL